jgi:hypothetical protein
MRTGYIGLLKKITWIGALMVCLVFFCGCSTKIFIRDFSSRDKFNEKVNNDFEGRTAYVEIIGDNEIHTGHLVAAGDTLLIYKDTLKVETGTISKTEIENIRYNNNTLSSGCIYLKNKRTIEAYSLDMSKDSVFYKDAKLDRDVIDRIPAKKIKAAYYKTYWPGIISKAIAGGAMGWLGGILISTTNNRKDGGGLNSFLSAGGGGYIGAIAGFILGVVFPTEHVYVFDPAL